MPSGRSPPSGFGGGDFGAIFRRDARIGQNHLDLMMKQKEQFVIGESSEPRIGVEGVSAL